MNVHITIPVEKDLKEHAENLFEHLGMNMTTAVNIFLRKAVDEAAIPFSISEQSTVFSDGYTIDDITNIFASAVKNDITENQKKGFPIARYDSSEKKAYLEHSDGTREHVD